MMNLNISKTSWHFRLLDKMDLLTNYEYDWDKDQYVYHYDTCSYIRVLLKGLFLALMCSAAAFGLIVAMGDTLGWIAAMVSHMMLMEPELGAFIILLITGLVAFGFACVKFQNWKEDHRNKEPGAIGELYRAFKDKTCKKITFVEGK